MNLKESLSTNDLAILKYADKKRDNFEDGSVAREEIVKKQIISVGRTQVWNILTKLEGLGYLKRTESKKPAKFVITELGLGCINEPTKNGDFEKLKNIISELHQKQEKKDFLNQK